MSHQQFAHAYVQIMLLCPRIEPKRSEVRPVVVEMSRWFTNRASQVYARCNMSRESVSTGQPLGRCRALPSARVYQG
jgi:hypothetical protein